MKIHKWKPTTSSEEEQALDYLLGLEGKTGTTLMQECQGDVKKKISIPVQVIARLAAAYHRDMTPVQIEDVKGRKFKT